MTDHDLAVLDGLRADTGSHSVVADDPDAVAAGLLERGGRRVRASELAAWADEAALLRERADAVLAAEEVVVGAEAFERRRRAGVLAAGAEGPSAEAGGDDRSEPMAGDPADAHADADRQAVRFALAILVPAQLAGIAVYVVDRTLLAVVAPAAGLVVVLALAGAARARPAPERPPVAIGRPEPDGDDERPAPSARRSPGATPPAPVVRAAEAHLRRQQAAWKLAWWERGLRPVDVATWVGRRDEGGGGDPATLVVVDDRREVEDGLLEAMTAALPASVRVVVLRRAPA